MGSLMAGWNSPRTSKKSFERTLSLTKEEIQQYWRSKPVDGIKSQPAASPESIPSTRKVQKSNTFSNTEGEDCYEASVADKACFFPASPNRELLKSKTFHGREAGGCEIGSEGEADLLVGSAPSGWWTKTDWAFLNEAPVLESLSERSKDTYVSQHSVATMKKVEGGSNSREEAAARSACVF